VFYSNDIVHDAWLRDVISNTLHYSLPSPNQQGVVPTQALKLQRGLGGEKVVKFFYASSPQVRISLHLVN